MGSIQAHHTVRQTHVYLVSTGVRFWPPRGSTCRNDDILGRRKGVPLIFLNYRRRDDAYAAALLDYMLSERFGNGQIFRASRSIPPGADYEEHLLSAAAECDFMLVMVSSGWVDTFDDSTIASDWVRREIGVALKNGVPVAPVLLTGATHLKIEELPPDVAELGRRQSMRFDYRNIVQDSMAIGDELLRAVSSLTSHDVR
jgi:TIR domain